MIFSKEYLQNIILKTDPASHAFRTHALNQFLASGFPTSKQEEWKYTDVSELTKINFELNNKLDINIDAVKIKTDLFTFDAYRIVFIDGQYCEILSSKNNNIISIISKNADNIAQLLKQSDNTGFSALNNALFQDGAYINIPDKTILNKPIHIVHIQTQNNVNQMNYLKHFIVAGEQSEASIIEDYIGLEGNQYFNSIASDIVAKQNSTLNHYRLQRDSKQAFHIAKTNIFPEKNAVVNTYHIALGSKLMRHDLNYCFNHAGASGNLIGLYYGHQNQHLDFHTRVDHIAEQCDSRQNYKGVMSDNARGVFNGKIIVHKNAQKTNAHLDNRNLLLSEKAEIDTKPELEIDADDVQCSHGATVGCLDEQALFYLQSRGISADKAKKILIQAFISEILDLLPNEQIQSYIRSVVMQYEM